MGERAIPLRALDLSGVLADPAVDLAVTMTAQMFGVTKATAATILAVGLPKMAEHAQANPELLRRMHAASLETMPEPLADFYARMRRSAVVRQSVMDDYKATYGALFDAANRAAAREAGTTDGQAREVLAALLPAVCQLLGQANAGSSRRGFVRQLSGLHRPGR